MVSLVLVWAHSVALTGLELEAMLLPLPMMRLRAQTTMLNFRVNLCPK